MRILLLLLLIVCGGLAAAWYSTQTLPSWYDDGVSQQNKVVEQLSDQISGEGLGQFLGSKIASVMSGELTLSETEFNALLLSGLQSSTEGRQLLNVSDAVNAQLRDGELEIGAILDLNKVAALDARARQAVEELTSALPFLDQSKIHLSVVGEPVARNGEISFSENFSIKVGSIPIPSSLLAEFGVPVGKASQTSFPLKYMTVRSIDLQDEQVVLGVLPSF